MTEPEYQNLKLNSRFYQYIRATAITNIEDALVELITNCVDAYINIDNNPNLINIYFSKNQKYIEIVDQAIGLNSENMLKCFFEVGTYNGNDNTRGHFSRGAKDIIALGNTTFVAIKDNKLSKCILLHDGRGAMLNSDIDVSVEMRNMYKINNNGLYVRIDLRNDNIINRYSIDNLKKHYALRDILSNDKYLIIHKDMDINDGNEEKEIKYSYPTGTLLVDGEYDVPIYNVKARFRCYLSENIEKNSNMKYSENGFLIASYNTIYENGMLHNKFINNNPNSVKLYGRVDCDYINILLKEFENNGSSELNPFPIIDSSRLTGLTSDHPFTKELLKLPVERVIYILTDLDYNNKLDNIQKNNIFRNLTDLQIIGNNIFRTLGIKLKSDFFLPNLPELPKLRQDFEKEDVKLPYSRRNARINTQTKKNNNINKMVETPLLSINFVDNLSDVKYKSYVNNKGITIDIPKNNTFVSNYLEDINNITDIRGKIYLADIITEALADIMTNNEMDNFDYQSNNTTSFIQNYNSIFHKKYSELQQNIFNIITNL